MLLAFCQHPAYEIWWGSQHKHNGPLYAATVPALTSCAHRSRWRPPAITPTRVGGWGALTVRGSAARSFCSSGSQAQLATAYGCAVPNFTACSPVVQQHDYGKDHRGTLPAEAPRAIAAEESTAGMANETFKMGALRHPYGAGRATGGHARPRRAGTTHVAAPDGHVAQLNGGQAAKKAAVEAPISGTGRDGAHLHYQWGELPKPTG